MGMDTFITGFVPPDDMFKKMKSIWEACESLKINPPKEVDDFFDGDRPDDAGVEVKVPHHEWSDGDMRQGVEINVDDIPENVKTIRFFNSW